MLDFICKSCGIRVQADDALCGKLVLCPVCNLAMTAPPPGQTAIATAALVPLAKLAPPIDGTYSEGDPRDETAIATPEDLPQAKVAPPVDRTSRESDPPGVRPLPPIRAAAITTIVLAVLTPLIGMAGLFGCHCAMWTPMMFDNGRAAENPTTIILFWTIITFPISCFSSIVFSWLTFAVLSARRRWISALAFVLPFLHFIFAVSVVWWLQTFQGGRFAG